MPRAVLDTNVIVFRSLSEHGPPDWIVDLVAAGELAADCDTRILAEYRDVQTRSRLNLNVTRVQLLLDIVQHTGIPITPMPWQVPLPDPDVEPFIACAKMALDQYGRCPQSVTCVNPKPPANDKVIEDNRQRRGACPSSARLTT